jgi:hypothetical protein
VESFDEFFVALSFHFALVIKLATEVLHALTQRVHRPRELHLRLCRLLAISRLQRVAERSLGGTLWEVAHRRWSCQATKTL